MPVAKPPYRTPIDNAHPLLRRLAAAGCSLRSFWTFQRNGGDEVVLAASSEVGHLKMGNTAVVAPDANQRNGRSVLVLDGQVTTIASKNVAGRLAYQSPPVPVTVLGRFRVKVLPAGNCNIFNSAQSANYAGVFVQVGASGEILVNIGSNVGTSSTSRRTGTSAAVITAGTRYFDFGGVVRGNTDMTIRVDGVSLTPSYSGSASGLVYSTGVPTFGAVASTQLGANANVDYWMLLAGDVPVSLIDAIHADPWGLLVKPASHARYAGAMASPANTSAKMFFG